MTQYPPPDEYQARLRAWRVARVVQVVVVVVIAVLVLTYWRLSR